MHDCHKEGVTVDRECDSPKGGVKGIRMMGQLMGRCDCHWEYIGSIGHV